MQSRVISNKKSESKQLVFKHHVDLVKLSNNSEHRPIHDTQWPHASLMENELAEVSRYYNHSLQQARSSVNSVPVFLTEINTPAEIHSGQETTSPFPSNGGFWFMPRELQRCRTESPTCPTSAQLPLRAQLKGDDYCSQKLSHKSSLRSEQSYRLQVGHCMQQQKVPSLPYPFCSSHCCDTIADAEYSSTHSPEKIQPSSGEYSLVIPHIFCNYIVLVFDIQNVIRQITEHKSLSTFCLFQAASSSSLKTSPHHKQISPSTQG